MNICAGEVRRNLARAGELISEAARENPDVIILPETWNTGFFPSEATRELADCGGAEVKALLSQLSRKYNVNIIGGSATERKNGFIYNTCYIYDRKGENIASYSKTHLFSPMGENLYYKAGDSFCSFEIDGIKAAVLICYDLRFPEAARRLALSGAEVLFIPAQWPRERIAQMEILLKARAVENQMYAVLCNSTGTAGSTVFGGNSLVISPLGEELVRCSDKEETAASDIDISEAEHLRKQIDVFSDRRPALY